MKVLTTKSSQSSGRIIGLFHSCMIPPTTGLCASDGVDEEDEDEVDDEDRDTGLSISSSDGERILGLWVVLADALR